MAGLAGFLSGTVSETLKKLVLPSGLVPAAIFTLLNLAFVYPPARDAKVGVATEFSNLAPVWQLTTVTVVVFVLGYLLVNLAPFAVETLAGDTWRGSALHAFFSRRQELAREKLSDRAKHPVEGDSVLAARMQLAQRFPLSTDDIEEPVEPTRLGNTIRATQGQIYRRWGIDITTLWSPLESAASVKDSPAMQTAADEKAGLQLMANLIMIAFAFVVEAFVFDTVHHRWPSATAVLLVLAVAYACYRIAVVQSRSWGDAVEVAIDLHRKELREALGLRDVTSVGDERQLWRDASAFYLPSDEVPDPAELFAVTPVRGVEASPSAGVKAEVLASDAVLAPPDGATTSATLAHIRYLILVSRSGQVDADPQAAVVVTDPRIRITNPPANRQQGSVTAKAAVADDKSTLIWKATGLDRGDAIALNYTLPLWRLELAGGEAVISDERTSGLSLQWPKAGNKTITFTSYLTQPAPPKLLLGNTQLEPESADGGVYQWTVTASRVWLVLPELPA